MTERAAGGMNLHAVVRTVVRLPALLIVGLIRAWQMFVSPLYGPTCRFYPSCTSYALLAVQRHGLIRGGWLAARRLVRCHPWNPGGVDDVPPVKQTSAAHATPGAVIGDPRT